MAHLLKMITEGVIPIISRRKRAGIAEGNIRTGKERSTLIPASIFRHTILPLQRIQIVNLKAVKNMTD